MRLFAPALAFVDLETTGTHAAGDRVTEVGIVRVEADPGGDSARVEEWSSLVDPGVPIPPVIQSLTGITDAMVRGAPSFQDIADQLLGVLAGRIFVAHNARFDWSFLDASLQRTRGLGLGGPNLCTVRLARRLLPGVGSCGLDNLTHVLALENSARHRAAGDADVTARLLERLLVTARGEGARTLDDLERIQRRKKGAPPDPGGSAA